MNGIGQPERETQNRVIALFRDELDKQIARGSQLPVRHEEWSY